MPMITPLLGEALLVQVGNGATPTEVFAHPAVINGSRSYTFTVKTEEGELIDVANLAAVAQTARYATSVDLKVDGEGMVSKADLGTWITWANSGSVKNVKINDGTTVITAPFILTQLQVSGERRKHSTVQVTLEVAGAITVTP